MYVKHGNTLNPVQIDTGIRRASEFLRETATATAREIGFGHVPAEDAPNTYCELVQAWDHSVLTGSPLPVASTNLDDCFYLPESVYDLRFVHDVAHMRYGLTFAMEDELELALIQMREFASRGLDERSLEYQLLYADHVGQAQCMLVTRSFVSDQSRFILDVLCHGLDEAILRELRAIDFKSAA